MNSQLITCAIVDDDPFDRTVLKDIIAQVSSIHLEGEYASAMEAYNGLAENPVDLLLVDVEMPTMTGLEFIASLQIQPVIIIVTAKPEYALEAYNYLVTDFLVKPVSPLRFVKAIEKGLTMPTLSHPIGVDGSIFAKLNGKIARIAVDAVGWIKSSGNYVLWHTNDGRYSTSITMKEVEARLPKELFIRIHRYYIVNLNHIDSVEDNCVQLKDQVLPISKAYRKAFYERINPV